VSAAPAIAPSSGDEKLLAHYLDECRGLVVSEIRRLVPRDGPQTGGLYRLMLDYPMRAAKGLRPALCIAVCRALGGHLEAVLPTAAALELYHNAFLLHDDVEDGSEKRRCEPTLHRVHGAPIAINVGDAMLALALEPLLDNTRVLGLGRALRILQAVARMARESAEGQMIELDWIRSGQATPSDRAYVRMVHKKTSWYSFVTPVAVGAIAAGAPRDARSRLSRFASLLGIAFQIQDDVLNLVADEAQYGKEIAGDLWEGKHTLILVHALRAASEAERQRAREILAKPRPADPGTTLARAGTVAPSAAKTEEEVRFLRELIDRHDSVSYAWRVAAGYARRAAAAFPRIARRLAPSVHRRFLEQVVQYVVRRDR
jgi:geranylgeranyl diphosphate synthase, type II